MLLSNNHISLSLRLLQKWMAKKKKKSTKSELLSSDIPGELWPRALFTTLPAQIVLKLTTNGELVGNTLFGEKISAKQSWVWHLSLAKELF